MLEAHINSHYHHKIEQKGDQLFLDTNLAEANIQQKGERHWHVIHKGRSYNVWVHAINKEEKTVLLGINGKKASVKFSSKVEQLLKALGMENLTKRKVDSVKAPMPGLVLSVKVAVGDVVKKGEALLILEAMKMENVIKSPTDGVISGVHVNEKNTVEKGALMIQFE